ncbi:MAG: hypothetical protein K0R57_1292 [Paenibacillaceae bacterium]|jgi:hypothetical protein|nr:hypothetical protein [Paenibacillaceae bacterium]
MGKSLVFKCFAGGGLLVLLVYSLAAGSWALVAQASKDWEVASITEANYNSYDAQVRSSSGSWAMSLAENGKVAADDSFDSGDWEGWYPAGEEGIATVDGAGSGIKLHKTESAGNLDVMKRLTPISGIVTIEYDVKTDEWEKWKCAPYILDGSNRDVSASIAFDNGNIKLYNGTQVETVRSFNAEQWYHFRLDINTDTDTFDFYIDGKQEWYNAKLRNPVNHVGMLLFKIGEANTGTLYFDNVKVYSGIRGEREEGSKTPEEAANGFSDDFESNEAGSAPGGWAVLENDGHVTVEQAPGGGSGSSMKLKKTATSAVTGASLSATKSFGKNLTGKISIEYRFLTEEVPSKWKSMYVAENLKNAVSLAVDGTSLKILGPSNATTIVKNDIQPNRWYSVKVIADTVADRMDLFVDQQQYLSNEPLRYPVAGLNKMDFIMARDSMGTLHIDDVRVYTLEEEEVIEVPGYSPEPGPSDYSLGDYAAGEPLPAGIVIEAENMVLSNYRTESSPIAHNGMGIAVERAGIGLASFSFPGPSGYYALHAGYYEGEGSYDSSYRLKHNGKEIDYWLGQYDDSALHVRHAKEYLYVSHGDPFVIEGGYGPDPAKLDYVEFAPAVARNLERGHLIDDSYWQPVGWVPSSWSVGEEGGTASLRQYNGETPFILDDVSTVKKVWAKRPFLPQTEGEITLEFKMNFIGKGDGVSLLLGNGTAPAVQLLTEAGNIVYAQADGSRHILVPGYLEQAWYGVKIRANPDTGKASMYVNGGEYMLENADFTNPAGELNQLYIETPEQGRVKLAFSVMELYKGYLIYDHFLTERAGSGPQGWDAAADGGSSAAVQEMKSNLYYDWNSLKLEDTGSHDRVSVSRSFPGQTELMTLEYEFLLPVKQDGISLVLGQGSQPALTVTTAGGHIGYLNADGSFVKLWDNYKANVWYNMKLVSEPAAGTADIYVNKIKLKEQAPLLNGAVMLDFLAFATSVEGTGTLWVDDIRLFQGAYASLVPEPVAPEVDSPYLVGIQTCDLWREGSHFGYDAIAPYDNRLPLLGYFDEGNPEVADWETKWMVEHGVGLYYPAWYRPKNTIGSPVKEPRNSAKLNEGFLNSKYADRISFAILWENGTGAADAEDFKNNVVQYWIERYFKHPSYLLIDNKPVIGIWKTDELAAQLGGVGGNAAVFAQVEDMLRAEGFDGAVFLAQYTGTDTVKSQELKDRGYDYTYIYNHTSNDMLHQLDRLQKQKSVNALPAIPSISQGWGDEPWGMSERKTNIPLADWKAGLEWLKDYYMPANGDAEASLGSRLLLLGNWNEIAEGHALIPSNIAGFGYLDKIREVFSSGDPVHADLVPKNTGMGPYDTMTPRLWSGEHPVAGPPSFNALLPE